MDNTVALLTNSAQTRGLPLNLIRNLPSMERSAKQPPSSRRNSRWKWNPIAAPNDKSYKVIPAFPGTKEAKTLASVTALRAATEIAYNPVGEVIKLAEGRDNLTLGRLFRRRFVP